MAEHKFPSLDVAAIANTRDVPRGDGGHGIRVTKRENRETALADGLAHEGPSPVEIVTDVDLI